MVSTRHVVSDDTSGWFRLGRVHVSDREGGGSQRDLHSFIFSGMKLYQEQSDEGVSTSNCISVLQGPL